MALPISASNPTPLVARFGSASNITLHSEVVTVAEESGHNGFPSLLHVSGGTLHAYYRAAGAHGVSLGSSRGIAKRKVSTDYGATWGAASTMYDEGYADVRDPMVTRLASGTLVMTFFLWDDRATGSNDATGPYYISSTDLGTTWTSPTLITSSFDLSAVSAPMIELANGTLLVPFYGVPSATPTLHSALVAYSTSGLAGPWTTVEVANGVTDGRGYPEPNVKQLANGTLLLLTRYGTTRLGKATSTDNGLTWSSVSELSPTIVGASGRASLIQLASGTVLAWARIGDQHRLIESQDNGATWDLLVDVFTPPDADPQAAYADFAEVASRCVAVLYASELDGASTNAHVFFRYAADQQFVSPVRGADSESRPFAGRRGLATAAR